VARRGDAGGRRRVGVRLAAVAVIAGAGLAAALALLGAAATIPSGSLTANPSFEVSSSGWSARQGALSRRMLADAPDGRYVVRVARRAGASYTIDDTADTVRWAIAGRVYTATAWVRAAGGRAAGKTVRLRIREKYPSGAVMSDTGSAPVTLTKTFKAVRLRVVPKRTGDRLDVRITQTGARAGDAFYADAISLTPRSGPTRSSPSSPSTPSTDPAPPPPPPPTGGGSVVWSAGFDGSSEGAEFSDPYGSNVGVVRREVRSSAGWYTWVSSPSDGSSTRGFPAQLFTPGIVGAWSFTGQFRVDIANPSRINGSGWLSLATFLVVPQTSDGRWVTHFTVNLKYIGGMLQLNPYHLPHQGEGGITRVAAVNFTPGVWHTVEVSMDAQRNVDFLLDGRLAATARKLDGDVGLYGIHFGAYAGNPLHDWAVGNDSLTVRAGG
jgi:hypothetical protein